MTISTCSGSNAASVLNTKKRKGSVELNILGIVQIESSVVDFEVLRLSLVGRNVTVPIARLPVPSGVGQ